MSETFRLICPTTGAFCGLVRLKRQVGSLCTVWAETPILDWLSTDEDGTYPRRMPYEPGHTFNCEANELEPVE